MDIWMFGSEILMYVVGAYLFLVVNCILYFWRAINKLHRSRLIFTDSEVQELLNM